MGRARITGGGETGLYSVEILRDTSRVKKRILSINERRSVLSGLISTLQNEYGKEQSILATLRNELNSLIQAYNEGSASRDDLLAKQAEILEQQSRMAAVKLRLDGYTLERTALNAELSMLDEVEGRDDSRDGVWCADYSEDLSGDVDTIEIKGEHEQILVAPSGESILGGQIQPGIAGTPAGVYYNWALFPAWQRWMPTYRVGVASNINQEAHTCSVSLAECFSRELGLPINQEQELHGVPIKYMECDSNAFENGDRVVVEFPGQSWDSARVIGFESNPKECDFYLLCRFNGYTAHRGGEGIAFWDAEINNWRYYWARPGGVVGPIPNKFLGDYPHLFAADQNNNPNPDYSRYYNYFFEEENWQQATRWFGVQQVNLLASFRWFYPEWQRAWQWRSPGDRSDLEANPAYSDVKYGHKVVRLKYPVVVENCPREYVEIEGQESSPYAYVADFTLYTLMLTETELVRDADEESFYKHVIHDPVPVPACNFGVFNSSHHYIDWPFGGPYTLYYGGQWSRVHSYNLQGNDALGIFCSDENGTNPSFGEGTTSIEYTHWIDFLYWATWNEEWEEMISGPHNYMENQAYPLGFKREYTMGLMPEFIEVNGEMEYRF